MKSSFQSFLLKYLTDEFLFVKSYLNPKEIIILVEIDQM